jgi:hypothetical protein
MAWEVGSRKAAYADFVESSGLSEEKNPSKRDVPRVRGYPKKKSIKARRSPLSGELIADV